MERTGLLEIGDVLFSGTGTIGETAVITEDKLPNSYYYTLGKAYAMSGNFSTLERLTSREGTVVDIKETPKGFFVTVEFDE